MKYFTVAAIFLLGFLVISKLSPGGEAQQTMPTARQYVIRVPDFHAAAYGEFDEAVAAILHKNENVVTDLMRQLRDKDTSNIGQVYAIYVLGEMRARRATTDLLDSIDTKASAGDPKTRIARWGMYPAQEALTKIGMPAVSMIVGDRLGKETDPLKRQLMCTVIVDVEGKEIGRQRVKIQFDQESDPERKALLQEALNLIK